MQVFVLGMHRSGTSTLSRLLNMMGLYFGTEGISTRANEENPKGFWERKDVRELNDYILQENGFDWNQIAGFEGLQTFSEESITQFDKKAKQLIINLDAFRPWFLKEPRFCLTLPLWKRHLEVPIIIFIYRHPLEVAKSLEYRNGYSLEYGLAMWERYTELAIEHSAGFPSLVVSYNKLLENPGEVINIIHEFLTRQGVHGLRVPNKRELDGFIDTSLHRQKVSSISLNELSSSQSNLFALLEHSLHDSINFSFKSGKIKKILKDSEESIMLDKQLKEDYLKLKEKLKENNLQLKQYEEKYKDDLKKIQEQNKELRQKQKEDINAFKSELQKVQIKLIEKTIESFKSDIKELKAQTQRLSQSLEKKSNELNSVTLTLEKERFIHQSDKKIIDELNSLTKEQRAQIESLEENLNTSKKHTRNVERHFQGIESRLASKVKSLQETLKQKEKQAKEKDSTIERLWQANQDSRISRRITKPFRFLFSLPVKVVKKITSFLKKKEPETFYSLVENLIDLNRYPQHTEFKSLYLASESSVAAAASEANDLLTKSNPLISVIMPTYNRADIILNAIQSVFDQSYTNWELIICDDESTDETSKVLGKITSSKLRYFKLKKQGAAAARNYGHSKSKGKYIAYLDSDNLWHPEFLRITIGALENRLGIHCVYTKYIDVERLKDKGKESFKIKSFKGLPFNYEKLAEKNYIDLNTFVHRKGLIDHYGGFNNQLKRQQDWDLILKYTFLRDPIYIDNYLVYYQRNESWNQITKIHKYDNSSLEIIRSNLSLYYKHGLQSKLRVNKEANPTITILSWDVCRNHFSKAYNIAEAICGSYNVQLLGFRFFEEEIFQPYKDETPPFELKIIEGSDFPGFHSAMSEALLNIKGDIVYAVKPRLSSLGLALLANHNFNKKVVLEFNDLETVVANPQKDKLNSAFDVNQLDLNSEELKSPYSLLWSNILEEFGQRMPVTTTHNKNLDRFFGSNSFYLRNLKDESYYDPLKYDRDEIRHSLGYSTSDRIILFGGLLRKHKGIFELIELLDKLNDERYKLLFVGSRETPDQRKLKESFGDKVQILPPQDRNYMAAINYASDLVVLWLDPEIPASHYQMPYKFTDAIAMKVPVIANDISDLGDLARQGYVKEVPHHDYDALVKGIKQIFDHPKKTQEMVEAGRNLYLRQFSYKAIKSNIDMLVDQNFELLNEVSKDFAELYGNFYSKSNNKAD